MSVCPFVCDEELFDVIHSFIPHEGPLHDKALTEHAKSF